MGLITVRSSCEVGQSDGTNSYSFLRVEEPAPEGKTVLPKVVPEPAPGTENSTPLLMAVSGDETLPGEIRSLRGHHESLLGPRIKVWTLILIVDFIKL